MSKDVGKIQQQGLTPPENTAIIAAFCNTEAQEKRLARRVTGLQVAATLAVASVVYSMKSTPQFAIAVLGGGGISIVNGVLLAWRMNRVAQHPAHEAHHQLQLLYYYATERFLVVVVLLGLCMLALKLSPLALMGGFVIGQAALIAARLFWIKFKDD
ncbi:MAG: ATP synthase subunit I [Gallionella sp.]|nr:MAG: ATP synthase subunit I [Gallionella sp.]